MKKHALRDTSKLQAGFTLAEILVISGVFLILTQLASINLFRFQQSATIGSMRAVIASDIRQQQQKAMSGDTQQTGSQADYGIFFETDRYTLFYGDTYSSGAPGNFVVELTGNLEISGTTLDGNILLFEQVTGEIIGSDPVEEIYLTDTTNGRQQIIRLNPLGVIYEII